MKSLDDICFVSMGCVLPHARNTHEFWDCLLEGKKLYSTLPEDKFNSEVYLAGDNEKNPEKVSSNVAGFIGDEILEELKKKYSSKKTRYNPMELITLSALDQNLSTLNPEVFKGKVELSLGCMNNDVSTLRNKFHLELQEFEPNIKDEYKDLWKKQYEKFKRIDNGHANSLPWRLKKRHQFLDHAYLVDAACASSLAAIDIGVTKLLNGTADFIFSGGVETFLDPISFVAFEVLGVLAKDNCFPFEESSSGMIQGEGAVILGMQRLEDAKRMGHKVLGVVKGIGGASDGRSSNLFSPSKSGQVLAYKKAYEKLSSHRLDYLECHGTGTKIGDETEISSIKEFFTDFEMPIGSVKALTGHTKAAAGGVGLLKTLLMFENKMIPPSPYISSPLSQKSSLHSVNKKFIKWRKRQQPYIAGVSSFGFGGINYHMILEEYKAKKINTKSAKFSPQNAETSKYVILERGSSNLNDLDPKLFSRRYFLSERGFKATDDLQKLALLSVQKIYDKIGFFLQSMDSTKISVFAASKVGLRAADCYNLRLKYNEITKLFSHDQDLKSLIEKRKDSLYPMPSEETAPGLCNNVVSGRVANFFDLKGKNFNISSRRNNFPYALHASLEELDSGQSDLIFVLWHTSKTFNSWLVGKESFCLEKGLSIDSYINPVKKEQNDGSYCQQ